jgi:hypothetical protein
MKVDFNEFISMEDCELRNLLFVAKKIEWDEIPKEV